MTLDVDFIRSQYPVFTNPETARWAMFENAGGSYVPRQVTDRLHDFFQFTKVQPYGLFEASVAAGEAMDAGYQAMADLHRDLFIALGDSLGNGAWSVRIQYKPMIRFIWLGCLVMALGGIIAASDRRYRLRARRRAKDEALPLEGKPA